VAVDDLEPFYTVYGGTQDNGSHGGPSRTDEYGGIRNAHWFKTLGADGHQSATEPGNPNIIYAETQQGGLHRVDRITGEQVFIQPQAEAGGEGERYNWDAPILVSPHEPKRIYFASQRVWRSENRGDSWTAISEDLTRNEERLALPIMGKRQSWDSPWDMKAMSNYNTITSLAESPLQEGLIYAGTDDGLIQVTEDGGTSWRKIEVSSIPGIPATAFVNDIKADLFDINTVYVALDNHKYGDLEPYLVRSHDRGKTWTSIRGDLPDRTLVWRIVQDHVKADLLFAATEFGVYVTLDGGDRWIRLRGAPTISFRDLVIQRRENDLVCASFGRGFFILDDYAPLRELTEEVAGSDAYVFKTRPAPWYVPRSGGESGANAYSAPNPPFGAMLTYLIGDEVRTLQAKRKEEERELRKENKDIPFPGWEALEAERREDKPLVWLTVRDANGTVIRRMQAPAGKGIHRVSWDLRHQSSAPIDPDSQSGDESPFHRWRRGSLAIPGTYNVSVVRQADSVLTTLAGPASFEVRPLRSGALEGASYEELTAYREAYEKISGSVSAANTVLRETKDRAAAMYTAFTLTEKAVPELFTRLKRFSTALEDLDIALNGDKVIVEVTDLVAPTVSSRLGVARRGLSTTYGPTDMHRQNLQIAAVELKSIRITLDTLTREEMPKLEKALQEAGAPWIVGQTLPGN
jgi:hypothetical protein